MHRLRIDFDEAGGTLIITHRCTVTVAGHDVTTSEQIELADPDAVIASLKQLIDSNRSAMEQRATEGALEHVAAMQGIKKRGIKHLRLGGSLGASGESR